ncbi:hypothetical protein ACJ73_06121 [Blastomyces percursus]|uniref:Integrase catalytic domain-containing protein n=1 Tax=Blastomyces percursus TaxID=1658174 RepID=A0A1J9Q1X2_9EURO|nr:hypothetical protein ACJ73_06121 [Blastomyces percursus]
MDAIMSSYGIKWEPTTPHSPHQDDVSERGIRTIMGRVRAFLLKGNLPKKFWADVLETVVAITNNTPTSDSLVPEKSAESPTTATASSPTPPDVTVMEDGVHLIDDEEVPNIGDPNSSWLRPAKSLAAYTPAPITGNLPKSYKDAISRPRGVGDYWKRSMKREVDDLVCRNTWDLIPRSDVPKGEPVVPGRWVFLEKDRPDDPNADPDGILRKSSEAVHKATWIRYIMMELGFIAASPIRIFADNNRAIDLAKVAAITSRSKHIDTRFHSSCAPGVIELEYVPTASRQRMILANLTNLLGLMDGKSGDG